MDIDYHRDLRQWVRADQQEWMQRVHDFQSDVLYESGCFRLKKGAAAAAGGSTSTRFKGLTTAMKQLLYTHAPKPKKTTSTTTTARPKAATTPSSSPDGASGAQRGTIVHRQVQHMATLPPDALKRLYPRGYDPWALRLYAAYQRRGWYPLVSEYTVYDKDLGIATAIDNIFVTRDGDLIIVEQKTDYANGAFSRPGHAYGFSGHVNVWRPELRALGLVSGECTPAKLARIQIGMGTFMLMRLLGLPLSRLKPYVVRIGDDGIDFLAVKATWMSKCGLPLYGYIGRVMRMADQSPKKKRVREKGGGGGGGTGWAPLKRIKKE